MQRPPILAAAAQNDRLHKLPPVVKLLLASVRGDWLAGVDLVRASVSICDRNIGLNLYDAGLDNGGHEQLMWRAPNRASERAAAQRLAVLRQSAALEHACDQSLFVLGAIESGVALRKL